MKRVELHYGGRRYSLADVTIDEVQARVAEALATEPHWLEVAEGEADARSAQLLITPGVPLAISAPE